MAKASESRGGGPWGGLLSPSTGAAEGLDDGGERDCAAGAVLRKGLAVVRTAAGSRGAHPARTHPPPPRLGELLDRLRKFSVLEAIMNRVDVQYQCLARSRNSR